MGDKSPRKPPGKKAAGKTLQEKRRAKKLKRKGSSNPFETLNRGQ